MRASSSYPQSRADKARQQKNRAIAPQLGDSIKASDIIGKVGTTGGSTGPHLHYEIWLNGNRNNRPDPGTINPFVNNLPLRK